MTIIQPHVKTSSFTLIIAILIAALLLGSLWLIMLYNQLVNLDHGVFELKDRLSELQTSSAELKDKTFSLFDSRILEQIAVERRLVKDPNPQYLEVRLHTPDAKLVKR